MRCSLVALSYHLLIQMPRKRRSLKISKPFGIFSGCKLIAPKVTRVDPGARQFASRSALPPPTALSPNRIGAPLTAAVTSSRRSDSRCERRADSVGTQCRRGRQRAAACKLSRAWIDPGHFRSDEFAAAENSERLADFQRPAFPRHLDQQMVRQRNQGTAHGGVPATF